MIVIKWVFGCFRYMLGATFGLIFDIVLVLKELFGMFESDGKNAPSFKDGFKATRSSLTDIADEIKEEVKQS